MKDLRKNFLRNSIHLFRNSKTAAAAGGSVAPPQNFHKLLSNFRVLSLCLSLATPTSESSSLSEPLKMSSQDIASLREICTIKFALSFLSDEGQTDYFRLSLFPYLVSFEYYLTTMFKICVSEGYWSRPAETFNLEVKISKLSREHPSKYESLHLGHVWFKLFY